MHYHARDMAVVRARVADIPIRAVVRDALRSEPVVIPQARVAQRFGDQREPAIKAIDLKREGPPRGRFIAPRLFCAVKTALERGEQALFFPQPPRLRTAHAVPRLRFRMHCFFDAWLVDHRFGARWCAVAPGSAHAAAFGVSEMPGDGTPWSHAGPGAGGDCRKKSATLFPEKRGDGAVERPHHLDGAHARGARRRRGRPRRYRDRHAACRKRASLSASQTSSASSMRLRARHRRPARMRAHIPASASGDRTRRRDEGYGVRYFQTHQPEHPVMKALIAQDRERSTIPRSRRASASPIRRSDGSRAWWYWREQARGRRLRAQARRVRARERKCARAWPRRGAARAHPRAASLPADGERPHATSICRSYLRNWLSAAPKRKGNMQDGCRRRSAEFFVALFFPLSRLPEGVHERSEGG